MWLLVLSAVLVVLVDALVARFRTIRTSERVAGLGAAAVLLAAIAWLLPERPVVEKIVGALLMPTGLFFVALFLASALSLRRAPGRGALLFAAWLFYSAMGSAYVGGQLATWLEQPYRDVLPLAERPFDAVFVLGGGVAPTVSTPALLRRADITPEMKGQLGSSGDRVALAARMYHAGLAPLLVASGRSVPGVGPTWESGPTTAAIWRSLGVPDDAILVLDGAYNTTMEIRSYAAVARERGFRRAGLISSAWHLRRAMALARREGLDVAPLPADRRSEPAYYGLLSLIPSGDGFESVNRAAWEWLGAAVGR